MGVSATAKWFRERLIWFRWFRGGSGLNVSYRAGLYGIWILWNHWNHYILHTTVVFSPCHSARKFLLRVANRWFRWFRGSGMPETLMNTGYCTEPPPAPRGTIPAPSDFDPAQAWRHQMRHLPPLAERPWIRAGSLSRRVSHPSAQTGFLMISRESRG